VPRIGEQIWVDIDAGGRLLLDIIGLSWNPSPVGVIVDL